MGMEDGSNYVESGGGGDVGGGGYGDIGIGDFNYGGGYGAGGESFVLDPGFGVGNESTGGDQAPIDWGFDTTQWPTLDQGASGPVADSMNFDQFGYVDLGNGYVYDPVADQVLDTGLQQYGTGYDTADSDYWRTSFENWQAFGVDTATAAQFADQDLQSYKESQGTIAISQSATELNAPPNLPDIGQYFSLPYVNNYNPWESPPYVPTFPEGPAPLPPSLPTQPIPLTAPPPVLTAPKPPSATSGAPPKAPGLPPACPGGQYHPYPIGHPSQNICVPFPPAQGGGSSGGQKAGGGSSGGGTSKPPTQQQQPTRCAPGQYYSTRARRCAVVPKCPTGFVFDPVLETCVRAGTQSRLPVGEGEPNIGDSLGELFKNTPWWLWGALAALLLLGGNNEQRKRVTVQHRRAT